MMSAQPRKFLKFVTAILLAQILLAEPLHGCCREHGNPETPSPAPPGPIPLEQSQLDQIANAMQNGSIDELRAKKTKTYHNQQPIVTEFTEDQMARILEVYRGFGRNQPIYETLLWEEDATTPSTNTTTSTYPIPHSPPFNSTRNRRSAVGGKSICPVQNIVQHLITAFNTDDELLQIVQFEGFNQWVLRQECLTSFSPEGDLFTSTTTVDILCQTIQRSVYLVAIRLDDDLTSGDIDVQEVQVESCSSFA